MTKKIFNVILPLSMILFWSCNTDPLRNAVDDFAIVVELEPIRTGLSIAIHEYYSKELITEDLVIKFDNETAQHTIDIFGDRIDSTEFNGGIFNVGFLQEITPNSENTHPVSFTVTSENYLTKSFHVSLSDTGLTHLNIDLFHRDNTPSNYQVSNIPAPVDSMGKSLPLPIPFDTTTGSSIDRKLVLSTDQNVFTNPVLITKNSPDSLFMLETTDDGPQTYIGYPTAYKAVSYAWSPNPDFVEPYSNLGINNGRAYRTLYKLEEFELIGEQDDFSPVWLAQYTGKKVYPLTFLFFNNTPGFDNALKWISNVKKTNIPGSMQAQTTFWNTRIFTSGTPYTSNVNFMDKIPLSNWFSQVATYSANGPALYGIYSNENDTSEYVQKFFTVQQDMMLEGSPGNYWHGFFKKPYYLYDAVRTGNLNILITGYAGYSGTRRVPESHYTIEILSEGYRKTSTQPIENNNQSTLIRDVPLGFAKITIGTPSAYETRTVDLSNYDGSTLLIDLPPFIPGLVDVTITANIKCSNPSESVRWSFLPNSSFRYKQEGDITYPSDGKITWNYDAETRKVSNATFTLSAIQLGYNYKFYITVLGTTQTTTLRITEAEQTIDFTMQDKYCS